MFRFTLIDVLWSVTFVAACFSATTGLQVPALPLAALLVVTLIVAELGTKIARDLRDYSPLIVGWIVPFGLARSDTAIIVATFCGPVLLIMASIGLFRAASERPHRKAAVAVCLIAWANLVIDAAPSINTISDLFCQTIACVAGLAACSVLLSWGWVFVGSNLAIFWTLQLGLVIFNSTAIYWGIGWTGRWIS